jgi:hypothetical protein
MPLFMDHHRDVEGLTAEAVADAHKKDLEIQDQHGVKYHRYWFNEETGDVYCLAEAPSKEAAEAGPPRGAWTCCGRDSGGAGRLLAPRPGIASTGGRSRSGFRPCCWPRWR